MCSDLHRRDIFFNPNGEVYVGQWLAKSSAKTSSQASCCFPWLRRPLHRRLDVTQYPCTASLSSDSESCSKGITSKSTPSSLSLCGQSDNANGKGAHLKGTIFHQEPRCREGWGIWLHQSQRYEGEWHEDKWHGIGCIDNRKEDRYIGQFARGVKSGCGLTISSAGIFAEMWDANKRQSKLPFLDQRCRTGCQEQTAQWIVGRDSHRSSAGMTEMWTVDEVTTLLNSVGFESSFVETLRDARVNGATLRTLASRSAVSSLKRTLRSKQSKASWRLLVILVEMLLKYQQKLTSPKVSRQVLKERFHDLEINEGELLFGPVIGDGGYGTVYRAEWMQTRVAVKAFRNGEENKTLRDFCSELRILQKLRHPNITLLLGFCVRPAYIIVTELVEGGCLFYLLHRTRHGPADWNNTKAMRIAMEMGLGMVYLHAVGVVHCDLKSSNVLLTRFFEVKLCDFGLAHVLGDKEQQSINIGCVGTHNWMAPEVLRGEGYSKAADTYSFGVIFLEMITRQIPFYGYTAAQIVGMVGYGGRRPQLPRSCPEPLCVCLRKTLGTRPKTRRPLQELVDDLETLLRSSVMDVEESLLTFFTG